MKKIAWILFLLLFYSPSFAGAKEEERPDREMLKLMEFLRDWEMIKDLDLMRQLGNLDRMEEPATEPGAQNPQRGRTKDRSK